MATVNEQLQDAAIEHQIDLTRYSGSVVQRMVALLNRADAELAAQLTEALADAEGMTYSTERIAVLLRVVNELISSAYAEFSDELDAELLALAGLESSFQAAVIVNALPAVVSEVVVVNTVTAEAVHAAAMARPFQGKLLREVLTDLEAAKAARIRDAVRMGFVEGQTTQQIVQRLRGTKAQAYADGLWQIDRRSAEAVVRTAITHTANYAREAVYQANEDLVGRVQWVSAIDMRTSAVCRSRDGEVYPVNSGPRPPAHFNCRSSTAPVMVSAWEALGLSKSEIDPGARASMDGQIPATTTYQDWLKAKPAAFQADILGPDRARLFREGGLTLDRFVDRAGKELTLDQLRDKYASAFERAGL